MANLNQEERKIISEIFNARYYELAQISGVDYVCALILRMFEKIGVLDLLKKRYVSADEIIATFNFIPKAKYQLEWMLKFLNQEGFLELREEFGTKKYFCQDFRPLNPDEMLNKGIEIDKDIIFSAQLMSYVISEYPNFFFGRKRGLDILFARENISLWCDYFGNKNSGYKVYNELAAFGFLKWALKEDKLKVLELGGGTAAGTEVLIHLLKEKNLLTQINEYIFSDISPVFLRLGNQTIMKVAPNDFSYSLKKLDFDKSLINQGLEKNSIDIVYAINALHVAKNLLRTLGYIYEVLKPGGKLIFCEYCRPYKDYLLFQEFIFCLLDNYLEVELDPILRPNPGFLDYPHWQLNLENAGFKNIEAVFNTDAKTTFDLKKEIKTVASVIKAEKLSFPAA